jgi:hypothetical protein
VINILENSLEDTVPNRQHLPEEPDMSPNLLGPTQTQSLPPEGESDHGDAAACRLGQFEANLSHALSFRYGDGHDCTDFDVIAADEVSDHAEDNKSYISESDEEMGAREPESQAHVARSPPQTRGGRQPLTLRALQDETEDELAFRQTLTAAYVRRRSLLPWNAPN